MLENRYDTQLLIEGECLDENVVNDYFTNENNSEGCPIFFYIRTSPISKTADWQGNSSLYF